jgi:serine/threonine protein kinase
MKICTSCGRTNPVTQSSCERCGAALATAHTEPGIGHVIGTYDVSELIGRGGMGSVYRARNARLERDVAIKLLNIELSQSQEARARMELEARSMAAINHPNVVQIYDILDHEGLLALVLAYADHGALSAKIDAGPLRWTDALSIMDGILSGLTAIHAQGLVHRDLKPDNILFDSRSDQPMITDLGIAHDADGRQITRLGAQLGTPEYMSPEQVRGTGLDARSDLYACGIVLYELLSGEVPFTGESEFDIKKGQVERDPDLSRLPPEVPQAVHAVIKRALEKAPSDRYPDATTMQAALKASGTGSAPVASSASRPSPKPGDRVTTLDPSMAGERRVTTLDPAARTRQPAEPTRPPTPPPNRAADAEVHVPKSSGSGALIAGAILGGCALIAGVVWMGQGKGSETSNKATVESPTTTGTRSKPSTLTEKAKPAADKKPTEKRAISRDAKAAKQAYRSMLQAWNLLDATTYYEHIIEGDIAWYSATKTVRHGANKNKWLRGDQWSRTSGNRWGVLPQKVVAETLEVLVETDHYDLEHVLLWDRGIWERWHKRVEGMAPSKKPTVRHNKYILMRKDYDGVWRYAGEGDSRTHVELKPFVSMISAADLKRVRQSSKRDAAFNVRQKQE